MRIAICGGPYGNPYALRAFVTDARARGAQRLFCLGDLGGFGADVDALWPILVGENIECIAGNYDVAIARADPDCGCGYRDPRDNTFAQLIYDHTLATTSRGFAAWMGTLPTQRRIDLAGTDLHLVHGSPLALNDFWWQSLTDAEHQERVAASGASVIACTHSGLPWTQRIGETLVVNVGVLGKPANDGSRDVWYALLDLDEGHTAAQLIPLAYDWRTHAASMRAAGLPEPFVETIETGWWTTCLESLPPAERSRGRYHLYRSTLPSAFTPAPGGWADLDPSPVDDDRPVIPLFGSSYFPSRLWIYTNFHCNLHCDYCAVASSPSAAPRTLTPADFAARVDEAVAEEFTQLYLTGGEPFLHPNIIDLLEIATDALPTVVLTNAIFARGRLNGLAALAGRRLTVQTSLDGARPATHDAHRGPGSFDRTLRGIHQLIDLGLPPLVALTETPENRHEIDDVPALLADLGLPPSSFAVRPMLQRGFSQDGELIDEDGSIPELTITADGLHWHPAGADLGTSPDMHIAPPSTPLADGKRIITQRFLTARNHDGSLPQAIHCAI